MKENKEKYIKKNELISKLINEFPKDIPALDNKSVLVNVNSDGCWR